MTFNDIKDVMSIGSPVIAFVVLIVGLRFHAKQADIKDAEHDEKFETVEARLRTLELSDATNSERLSGMRAVMEQGFDRMDKNFSEIFRRLNKDK